MNSCDAPLLSPSLFLAIVNDLADFIANQFSLWKDENSFKESFKLLSAFICHNSCRCDFLWHHKTFSSSINALPVLPTEAYVCVLVPFGLPCCCWKHRKECCCLLSVLIKPNKEGRWSPSVFGFVSIALVLPMIDTSDGMIMEDADGSKYFFIFDFTQRDLLPILNVFPFSPWVDVCERQFSTRILLLLKGKFMLFWLHSNSKVSDVILTHATLSAESARGAKFISFLYYFSVCIIAACKTLLWNIRE